MNRVIAGSVAFCVAVAVNCSAGNPSADGGGGPGGGLAMNVGGGTALAGGFAGGVTAGGDPGGGSSGLGGGGGFISSLCGSQGGGDPSACVCPPDRQDLAWLSTFASCQTAPPGEAIPVTFRFHNVNTVPVHVSIGSGSGYVSLFCVFPLNLSSCNGVRLGFRDVCAPYCDSRCEACSEFSTMIPPGQSATYQWDGRTPNADLDRSIKLNLPAGSYRAGITFWWVDDGGVVQWRAPDGGALYAETPFMLRPDAGEVSIPLAL